MTKSVSTRIGMLAVLAACALSGCAVVAVADATVTVAATVVKAGATVAGAAVDVAGAAVSATAAGVRAVTSEDKPEKAEKPE
jgi:hypothetical protein